MTMSASMMSTSAMAPRASVSPRVSLSSGFVNGGIGQQRVTPALVAPRRQGPAGQSVRRVTTMASKGVTMEPSIR